MRVAAQLDVSAPREVVWEWITDPARQLNFLSGVTRWEVCSEQQRGCGARYRMLMRVGSAEVGGLVEVVEFDEPGDMAWTSVTGLDQRGRWRLRELPDGRTRVTLRLSYDAPGGILATIADRLARSMVSENLEKSLEGLKSEFEGSDGVSEDGMGLAGRV